VTAASDSNRNRAGDEQGKEVAAEQLGKSVFIDDRLAPAIDREFLRKFVRDELREPAASAACRLIIAFRNWSEAYKEIVAEESSRAKKA
jgi:hypothetical protein